MPLIQTLRFFQGTLIQDFLPHRFFYCLYIQDFFFLCKLLGKCYLLLSHGREYTLAETQYELLLGRKWLVSLYFLLLFIYLTNLKIIHTLENSLIIVTELVRRFVQAGGETRCGLVSQKQAVILLKTMYLSGELGESKPTSKLRCVVKILCCDAYCWSL